MKTNQFLQPAVLRLLKFKFVLILFGLLLGTILFMYRQGRGIIYTSKATVFPLTTGSDNNSVTSTLTSLLGINADANSFTQDASINIVELALSRFTREAVALEHVPERGNKTIAELLINNHNTSNLFFLPDIPMPKDSIGLAAQGSDLLEYAVDARINKNGILEVNFSGNDEALVKIVTYSLINNVSKFYIDLRIRKAKEDYDFISQKVDSLKSVMGGYDNQSISMANATYFVSPSKLEYQMPKLNIAAEKERVMRQYNVTSDNREEALWRLQKMTPIVAVLDKPEPPFDFKRPYSIVFAFVGFIIGMMLMAMPLIADIAIRYALNEVRDSVFGTEKKDTEGKD